MGVNHLSGPQLLYPRAGGKVGAGLGILTRFLRSLPPKWPRPLSVLPLETVQRNKFNVMELLMLADGMRERGFGAGSTRRRVLPATNAN
jgi:hypothetical protein